MTLREKILTALVAGFFIGAIGFFVKLNPPQNLGSGSLYIPSYEYSQEATQATTTLFAFSGVLHTLSITKPVTNSIISVYDSATSTSPTVLIAQVTISPTSTPFSLFFDTRVINGLTIAQSGATSTLTASYQQQ